MKHIIDTDELEKLEVKGSVSSYNQKGKKVTDLWISKAEVLELLANSPQADSYGQDFNLEYTCKRIRRLLNALGMSDPSDGKDYALMGMLFTLLGTICSKLEKPQADDVRKDAERFEWIEREIITVDTVELDESFGWIFMQYYQGEKEPREVYRSYTENLRDAIDQAIDKARE